MSSSRKEEERNEKIIRGLLKLPPNRRCINCNSVGPQYVCTNFWTFVCIACSGIHREFTHRVKSVSMAKFTSQEVEALQKGGNQRAREIYLRDWDPQQQRLPDSSNPDRVRDFIKSVYVDKKYGGGKASDKPPRDLQSQKSLEDDLRRASSYHSYSQSPPYDNQYEERRYGKQAGVLTRRPGSDRGHYYDGKLSSFIYSPGRSGEQMSEDRFSNEGFSSRASDFSVSSGGDPFRSGAQSPTLQKEIGFNSPPAQSGRNFTSEDLRRQSISVHSDTAMKRDVGGIPRPQRTASSGSFGSFDSNTVYRKSVSSGCLADTVLEPEQSQSLQSSVSAGMAHWDPFGPSVQSVAASSSSAANIFSNVIHQPVSEAQTPEALLVPSIDLFPGSSNPPLPSTLGPSTSLFAGITQQPVTYVEQQVSASPSTVTEGWATFDLPQHATSTSETKQESATNATATGDALPEVNLETLTNGNNVMLSPVQSSVSHGPFPMTTKQGVSEMLLPSVSFNEAKQESVQMMSSDNELKSGNIEASAIADPKLMAIDGHFFPSVADQLHKFSDSMQPSIAPASFQSWNAFEDSFGSIPEPSFHTLNRSIEPQGFFERPSTSDNEIPKPPEDSLYSGFEINSISSSGLRSHIGGVSNGAFHLSGELSSHAHEHKSINPFDLPNDLEAESSNWFYDMSSLQAALPDPSLPLTYGADLTHPWLPQSSLVPYIPPMPQGGLTYMPAQMQPPLPNHSAQSSMASLGGNPFA